jgi:hypothetical protein
MSAPVLSRRTALQLGTLAPLGLTLPGYLQRAAAGETRGAVARQAIVVWLGGGPPHLDSFDMKPKGPTDIRGEFRPIKTNVGGIEICEHLPALAKCADRYAILRGVSHTLAGHELGTSYLSTGSRPVPSLTYPGYGAVVSKELPGAAELPHFVAVPGTPQTAGYLGVSYAPLATGDTPRAGKEFSVRGFALDGQSARQTFERRENLRGQIDTAFAELETKSSVVDGLNRFDQQAYQVISSSQAREAFDTSREPPASSERFGEHRFGQSCLLASRLIGAGVRFVTVNFTGWDTHSGNFKKTKESLLPQLDQGLAALLARLDEEGLLESTAVLVTGEFGRTPKINQNAGRDHWPRAFSVLMAGGGVRGGQVLGASDNSGAGPAHDPITPEQVAASFYATLGIDARKEYHTSTGRPVRIVRGGSVIAGLMG